MFMANFYNFAMNRKNRTDRRLLSYHRDIRLGSNVAKYSGEGLHKRIVADKAFAKGDFLAAIKNGFLEMDRALRYGMLSVVDCC